MHIFIDDDRDPKHVRWVALPENVSWTIVRSYNEFKATIKKHGLPKFVTFDHDLADEHYDELASALKEKRFFEYSSLKERTGYDCAMWLIHYCKKYGQPLPEYQVHTLNHFGGYNIRQLLESFKRFQNENPS